MHLPRENSAYHGLFTPVMKRWMEREIAQCDPTPHCTMSGHSNGATSRLGTITKPRHTTCMKMENHWWIDMK